MSTVPSNLIPKRITQLPTAPVASEDSLIPIVYQGNNYKIRAGDLLSVAGVPPSRQVIAGTGLTGGGQLTDNVTLSIAEGGVGPTQLATTGVTAGVYGSATQVPVVTVSEDGRVTAVSNVTIPEPTPVVPTADANTFYAGPVSGFPAAASFRQITTADVPTLNQDTTGTAANVTGVVALTNGGTGQTSQQASLNVLAGAITAAYYLRGNGANVVMSAIQATDVPTLNQNTTGTAANVTGTVAILNGGTGQTTRQAAINGLVDTTTATYYLRGNGTNAVMSAIQAADVPTLNQNTTGTAANVTGVVAVANGGNGTATPSLVAGSNITVTGAWPNQTIAAAGGGGSGTVTSVSVVGANGFAGTVATATTTPAITLTTSVTGLLKGNGTAVSAATAGTDYVIPTGTVANVTGTVAIANGGTGATTQQGALNALAAATTSTYYLRGNGTNVVMSAIQAGDVPTLNQNTTGTASNVTGTVAFGNGGTGQTTRQDAMDALAGATTSGYYLRGNGADVVMAAIVAGDVPTLNQNTTGTAANVTGIVAVANGGSGTATPSLVAGSNVTVTGTWPNQTIAATVSGTVTAVTGTSPVVSSGGATPAISLAASYGDTQNPYASKTANYILAAPNGTTGVPTFRAVVAADIPTLNQNTTGTAANVTGVVAVANGGSGTATPSLVAGTNVTVTGTWPNQTIAAAGGGTVTSVSVVSANGLAGTVATATTTPAITLTTSITGLLKGNGTAISAAVANTDYVTPTGTVTLTNKTLTDPVIIGTITEDVFAITDGASVDLNPANGSIQTWTLGANRTATASSFGAGESMTVMVNDGTAYALTWPTTTWVGGSAPKLATTGYTVVELWKVSTTLYGAIVGYVA